MKDHKPDFVNNLACRLVNPSKSEIDIISKHLLDGINSRITQATKVNLWRSTSNVIEWFNVIPEKCWHAFITFDICQVLPINIQGTANDGVGLRIKIDKDRPTRMAYHNSLKKITPLPPKLPMDQKNLRQCV